MAQKTIRLDCIDSAYYDHAQYSGSKGETEDLIVQTYKGPDSVGGSLVSPPTKIYDFAIMQFNVPEEIKRNKIVSAKIHFYATAISTADEITGESKTDVTFGIPYSSLIKTINEKGLHNLYFNDVVEYDSFIKQDDVKAYSTSDFDNTRIENNYSNFTNFSLPVLDVDKSGDNAQQRWETFSERFFGNGIYIASIWRTELTLFISSTSTLTMKSSRTSNPPYIEIVIDDDLYIVPKTKGFVDTYRGFKLNWAYEPTIYLFDPQVTQKSAEVRIRKKGEESYQTYSVEGNTLFAEIPGQQFLEESYEWQVYAESDDGRIGTSEWVEITTTDAISDATVIYPDQVVIDGSQPVRLEWEHVISTGSLPRGFDVQYRRDGDEWQDLVEQKNTDAQYYDLPGNTLPSGNVEWRVRTYNSNLVAGNWSDPGVVIVRGASPAPIITQVTTQPRPTITWESEDQIMAQIRIGDSVKTLYSAVKTYKWPDFLPDGPVMVEVRVQNEFGLWSQWGSRTATIKNQAQEPVAVSARIINYSASLSVVSSYPNNYIYRDGVLLGKVSQVDDILSYIDYESVGKHNYQAMGVDEQDNYQMSNMITVTVSLDCGMIGQAQSPEWIMLKRRRGSFPAHSIKTKKPVSLIYYQGKSLPVAHVSESLEVEHTLEFTVDKSTADQLQKLIGESIIYKDVRGDLIVGVMSGIECSRDRSTDVKITIDETQKEVIEIA